MSSRQLSYVVFLAIGLMGAAVLLWIAQRSDVSDFSRNAGPPAATARIVSTAVSATPSTPVAPDLSPAARALLAALQQALATGDQRPKEALLSFKDEAALRRFLERAGKNGLTVLNQSDRLRTVRVRYDTVGGLQQELAENATDLDTVSANNLFQIPQPPATQDRAELEQVPFGNETLAYLGANLDRSTWGRGVTVAILDTGVGPDATFGANRLRALDIGRGVFPGTGANDGHGTGVAALAAGLSSDAAGGKSVV